MLGLLLAVTSCTSYKTVPYLQNSSTVNYDPSQVLYDARIMPKDEPVSYTHLTLPTTILV